MKQKILDGEIGIDLRLSDMEGLDSVLINSPGGSLFEGLAMYDYVAGNSIEVGVIGVSASAATLPLIASETRWGTPNSRYLIHNPWSMEIGDAAVLDKSARELKAEQERALNLYVKHLNGSKEELQALMNEERILDAEEALQLGLIKEIRNLNDGSDKPEGTDIMNLFNQFKMSYEMKEEEKKELSGLSKRVDELTKMVKNFFSPKMLVLQDTNGVELDFGTIENVDQIAVGVSATVEGNPAEGEFVMGDGTIYVFTTGELTEIKEPEGDEQTDVEALKAENEALKQELAATNESLMSITSDRDLIKAKFDGVEKEFNSVKTDFEAIKNKFSDDKPIIKENKDEDLQIEVTKFNKSKLKNQKTK